MLLAIALGVVRGNHHDFVPPSETIDVLALDVTAHFAFGNGTTIPFLATEYSSCPVALAEVAVIFAPAGAMPATTDHVWAVAALLDGDGRTLGRIHGRGRSVPFEVLAILVGLHRCLLVVGSERLLGNLPYVVCNNCGGLQN